MNILWFINFCIMWSVRFYEVKITQYVSVIQVQLNKWDSEVWTSDLKCKMH